MPGTKAVDKVRGARPSTDARGRAAGTQGTSTGAQGRSPGPQGRSTGPQGRLAAFIEREYAKIPFMSVAEIAAACGVGKATVSRFVQRLGYESFRTFKEELQDEIYVKAVSPAARHAAGRRTADVQAILEWHRERSLANVRSTLDELDAGTVAQLCSDLFQAGRVYVYGLRLSYGLAFNLGLYLQQLLPDVRTVDGAGGTVADTFGGALPSDHVLIVAQKRVGREKVVLAQFLAERGVPFSVLTDLDGTDNPLTRQARHVLRARTEGVGAFNSYVATQALVHAVVAALEVVVPTARSRLTSAEAALGWFSTFADHRGRR
jgi:DNA-binding MurR/RpiR family transcriptional regulator